MKTTAAVLVETGHPLEITDLDLPDPKPGQVVVEIAYSGVCHTQLLECRGYRGSDPFLPHCLGHEASGTVLEATAEVTKCRPGDRVILSWIKGSGADVPGTVYSWKGRTVNAGGVTTFMTLAVVSENRVTVLEDGLSLDSAWLVGCAGATGAGAVWNTAGVKAGDSLGVFGVGGVGLCAIAAGRASNAATIIAVDLHKRRLEVAKELGADLLIDASKEDVLERIREAFPSGLDHAVEASGVPSVMRQALACVRARGGRAVVIGNARFGERLEIDPQELNQGKRLLGTWGGDCDPDRDFAAISRGLADGSLPLDRLVGKHYALSDINEAVDDLENGQVTRPVIDMTLS